MAEATQRLQQDKIRASMGIAVNVLARQAAIKATKRQLQAQGLRFSQFSHRDLVGPSRRLPRRTSSRANRRAAQIVERWRVEGFFGKRAKYLSDAQRPKA